MTLDITTKTAQTTVVSQTLPAGSSLVSAKATQWGAALGSVGFVEDASGSAEVSTIG